MADTIIAMLMASASVEINIIVPFSFNLALLTHQGAFWFHTFFHRGALWRKQARGTHVSSNVVPMESGGFCACRIQTPHSKMFVAPSFRSSCLYYVQLIVALIMAADFPCHALAHCPGISDDRAFTSEIVR